VGAAAIGRIGVVLAAVVAIAWLGLMERDARLQARGLSHVQARQTAQADSDLRRAGFLNPDSTPDLSRALVLFGDGHTARAQAMLESVIQREPQNVSAWGELLVVSRRSDPATARRATAVLTRLDPLDAAAAR
jgi:Tfp pilus assembly protein PilF